MTAMHPLLAGFSPMDTIGWSRGAPISAGQFCAAAANLACTLPKKQFVLNLCNDRLNFMLAFAAALLARQTSLLPQSKAIGTLRDLRAAHPDSYCLADDSGLPAKLPAIMIPPWPAATARSEVPLIAADRVALIAFTSGSTRQAQPHAKTWATLVTAAGLLRRRLGIEQGAMLGTVPPQHVYGFETTVMLPLQSGMAVYSGSPLLAADVAAALNEMPAAPWLATTPTHLRAWVGARTPLPRLGGILSATMPLSVELAKAAEQLWSAPIHEIYGSTETGVVALRRTASDTLWRVSDGMRLRQQGNETWVEGGQFAAPTRLPDLIALSSNVEFTLLGRPQDMVKIAGKRASLEELNRELLRVRGVHDGAFFVPEPSASGKERLAAVVVAPGADPKAIMRSLRERIDPAFLPRPLQCVDALPRNAMGKLPREALLALARAAKMRDKRSA